MHSRSIIQATLVHGALIVGVGLGVQPWITPAEADVQIGILAEPPAPPTPSEPEYREDVPVEFVPEAEFEERELPKAPVEDVAPEEPAEDADAREVDAHFAVPERVIASEEWLLQVRPERTERAVEPAEVVPPESKVAAVEASRAAEPLDHLNKKPVYPRIAERRRLAADVLLLVTVKTDGTVGEIMILESAGETPACKAMNNSALKAIMQWRYRPAIRDGVPVEVQIRVPIEFRYR